MKEVELKVITKIFPFAKHFNKREIEEFCRDLSSTLKDAISTGNWVAFEEMYDSWVATAEAKSNPEINEILTKNLKNEKFTRVE